MKTIFFCICLLLGAHHPAVTQSLHIVATGDTKGYLFEENVEFGKSGGILERQAAINQLQSAYGRQNMLLFDTGDALGYYYLTTASHGRIVLDKMRDIGYDAMVVGNHEFDFGKDVLKAYVDDPSYPSILGANVLGADSLPYLQPYKIVEKAGLRVGIIGVTDPAIMQSVLEEKMAGIIIADPSAAIRAYIDEVREQSDAIVLLTHLSEEENNDFAREFPEINVIIGKSSYIAPDRFSSVRVSDRFETFVFSVDKFGRNIPHITMEVQDRKIHDVQSVEVIELASETIYVDPAMQAAFEEEVELAYAEHCETAYGLGPSSSILKKNWMGNKDLRDYMMAMMLFKANAEIAVINDRFFDFDNYIANAVQTDTLTVRDFERIFWIENDIVTLRLKGEEILKIIKRSDESRTKYNDRFVHLKAVNSTGKTDGFNVHGRAVLADQFYTVVTSNFLANGGDGYNEFLRGTRKQEHFALTKDGWRQQVEGKLLPIRKTFIEYLIENKDRNIPRRFDHPVWFMTMRKIGFQAENKTKKNDALYKDYSINELQGEEKVAVSSSLDMKLTRWTRDLIIENYIKSEYGRIKLGNDPYRESDDNWSVESLVALPLIEQPIVSSVAVYPYAASKFQSEFTADQGPRKKDLYIHTGAAFSDFWNFSENRVGLVHLTRIEGNERRIGNFGVGVHSLFSNTRGNYGNFSEFEFIYFFTKAKKKKSVAEADSASSNTRSLRFNWSSLIAIERFKNFYFNPGVNFFAYKGYGRDKWAYSVALQFGLVFTAGWKFW